MTTIVQASGPSIRAICALVRRRLGIVLRDSREVLRSGGEDSMYRVHLADGTIVEASIVHAPAEVEDIRQEA